MQASRAFHPSSLLWCIIRSSCLQNRAEYSYLWLDQLFFFLQVFWLVVPFRKRSVLHVQIVSSQAFSLPLYFFFAPHVSFSFFVWSPLPSRDSRNLVGSHHSSLHISLQQPWPSVNILGRLGHAKLYLTKLCLCFCSGLSQPYTRYLSCFNFLLLRSSCSPQLFSTALVYFYCHSACFDSRGCSPASRVRFCCHACVFASHVSCSCLALLSRFSVCLPFFMTYLTSSPLRDIFVSAAAIICLLYSIEPQPSWARLLTLES